MLHGSQDIRIQADKAGLRSTKTQYWITAARRFEGNSY
jgi:hypothetical protein